MKRQTGITLIALVVTIIVLIILAGVTIILVVGNNGIFSKANEAKMKMEIADAKEKAQLDILAWKSERIANHESTELTDEIIKSILTGKEYVGTVKDVSFTTKQNEYEIPFLEIIGQQSTVTLLADSIENKKKKLTIQINSIVTGEKTYTIYEDNKSIKTQITDANIIVEEYTTSFGNKKIYVEVIDKNGTAMKSNEIELEDMTIGSAEELKTFRNNVNQGNSYEGKVIEQVNDIDLQASDSDQWIPIGNGSNPFKGTYDGVEHKLQTIYINTSSDNQALFGCNEGTVKNVGLESGSITGGNQTAGIVAINNEGTIEKCYNKATINGTGVFISGICSNSTRGVITKCYNEGKITGNIIQNYGRTCGISSNNNGTWIAYCYNTGAIQTITDKVNARAAGITNTSYTETEDSTILSCYNTGAIQITSNGSEDTCPVAAGVMAQLEGNAQMKNCYNVGTTKIIALKEEITKRRNAGVAGYCQASSSIENSYWLTGVSLKGVGEAESTADISKVYEKTMTEMKNSATLLGSDFKEDTNNINNGYPILSWQ